MKNIKSVLAVITVTVIIYGIAVFISLEPNPVDWDFVGRGVFAFICVIASALSVAIINDDDL